MTTPTACTPNLTTADMTTLEDSLPLFDGYTLALLDSVDGTRHALVRPESDRLEMPMFRFTRDPEGITIEQAWSGFGPAGDQLGGYTSMPHADLADAIFDAANTVAVLTHSRIVSALREASREVAETAPLLVEQDVVPDLA